MKKANRTDYSPMDYSPAANKRLSATIRLYDALVNIRDMPERDKDDAVRLRHIAATAIQDYESGELPPHEKNKLMLSRLKVGETRFVGDATRQNLLQAARRLGIRLATRKEEEGMYIWRVK